MDLNGFALAEVVAMPFTPLAVTLGKGSEAHVPHTVHMPKGRVNALFDSPVREDGSQKWVDFATAFWHVDCVRNMSLAAFAER